MHRQCPGKSLWFSKSSALWELWLTSLFSLSALQNESVLIQKIYTHFKKAPGTHKLGVLYVVDSVTRQWVEAARRAGQPAGSAAPDGTFAAGVNRVTELLPVLMTDIINNAPEDQKVRTTTRRDTTLSQASHPRALLGLAAHLALLFRVPLWPFIRPARCRCISHYITPCLFCIKTVASFPFSAFSSLNFPRIVQLTYLTLSCYRKKSRSWLISGSVGIPSLSI